MKDGVRMGLAVGLGYLLGRTRKMRVALMLVGVGVTGRFGKGPGTLAKQGLDLLGSSTEVKELTDTVRGRLVEAGKAAAVSAVSSQVDTLADKIEQRAGSLSAPPVPGRAEEAKGTDEGEESDEGQETHEGQAQEEQQEEQANEKAEERRPRRTSTRRPRQAETAEGPADEDRERGRPRRPARPSGARPPVRRTRGREQ